MKKKITIAIDAMGGENSPKKNIKGLGLFLEKNKDKDDYFFNLYGDKNIINKELTNLNISNNFINVIHTEGVVSDEETPLTAVKNSKNTSMWNSIKSQIINIGRSDYNINILSLAKQITN